MKRNNVKSEENFEYTFEVLRGKEIKDGVVVFDMRVNGINIYGCWYREYTNKDGKAGTMISFPSRQGDDQQWYNYVWFPISADDKANIIAQLEKVVE